MFIAGLDLGQSQDYTALILLDQQRLDPDQGKPRMPPTLESYRVVDGRVEFVPRPPPAPVVWHYEVRGIRRYPLGTSYPAIVDDVVALGQRPELDRVELLADATGVGAAIVDMFDRALRNVRSLRGVQPVVITAGHEETRASNGAWHVPKRNLVASVQRVLQEGRIKLPKDKPEAGLLVNELQNYQVKLSDAGHDSYNARQGQHDDLVLALALAVWWGERQTGSLGILL